MVAKQAAVVIGGSAGSLPAFKSILGGLPADFPCPILMVQHRKCTEQHQDLLVDLLERNCRLPIYEAYDKMAITPGVYVAPCDYHLLVNDACTVALSVEEPVNFSRPSIDVLFETAADVFGRSLIAVLLSGASSDGALGMCTVKRKGGTTIVQDPQEAESGFMPAAAIRTKQVDHILAVSQISPLLERLSIDFRTKGDR